MSDRTTPSRRSQRRHHRARLKKVRAFYHARNPLDPNIDPQWRARDLGRILRTPQGCSCYGCGNPRRHAKELTMQERKFHAAALDAERALVVEGW